MVLDNKDKLIAYLKWYRTVRTKAYTKNKNVTDVTIRTEGDHVSIFSNDLQKLKDIIKSVGVETETVYTEAKVSPYKGVIYFSKEPKNKYRVYLRAKRCPEGFRDDLRKFVEKHKDVTPSRSLKYWLDDPEASHRGFYNYTSGSHHLNYDTESTLSYLMLMYGEMMGHQYELEKTP